MVFDWAIIIEEIKRSIYIFCLTFISVRESESTSSVRESHLSPVSTPTPLAPHFPLRFDWTQPLYHQAPWWRIAQFSEGLLCEGFEKASWSWSRVVKPIPLCNFIISPAFPEYPLTERRKLSLSPVMLKCPYFAKYWLLVVFLIVLVAGLLLYSMSMFKTTYLRSSQSNLISDAVLICW